MEYSFANDISKYVRMKGRIVYKDGAAYLGFTNSSITVKVNGGPISMHITSVDNGTENRPMLRLYIDGVKMRDIPVDDSDDTVLLASFDNDVHELTLVKITEAAMSHVAIHEIYADNGLLEISSEDDRKKIEFIGDSITCGYGVLAPPVSEYTVRDEDGELSYSNFVAKGLDLDARWVSISGYGVYVDYQGNPELVLPKYYPYQNKYVDDTLPADYDEFKPDLIIVNLGTNDSGHLHKPEIEQGFYDAYEKFLYYLREVHPEANILCVLGTLAPGFYKYVDKVLTKVKAQGFERIYGLELPEHDVANDGIADGHPSRFTHKKDADRIIKFIQDNNLL